METDNQLLELYARSGSEPAFRQLVERHINLVHSAAVRESRGNPSLAEDITQAVFTELALRAASLVRHPALAGWLYTCVRRMTANVRRAETQRQRREQQAFTMNELLSPDPADKLWQQVWPELDDVMHELSEADRTAVVLRFFEGRSLKEVGLALGLTENAARMRVERSLEKLREILAQRGVKSTTSTLAAVLAAGAVLTAPSTLASTVAAGALVAATGASSSAAVALTKLFGIAKTQIAATSALLVLVAAFFVWHQLRTSRRGAENAQSTPLASPVSSLAVDAQNDSAHPAPPPTHTARVSPMALIIAEAETGEPLARAKLHLAYLRQDGRSEGVKAVTDAKGKLAVDGLQPPFHGLNMFVTADGHVPKVTSWGFGRAMPSEYTMKLERGVAISGAVVDEAGHPIVGAKIEFDDLHGNDSSLQENIQFGPDTATWTDADGRWSCNMIPKELETVSLLVVHPDHAETTATLRPQETEATNSIIIMKAGFTVAGVVLDSDGNPIDGAKVREVRLNSEGERSKATDVSGTFEFKSMKAGELVLAVQAKGFAPAAQTLQVTGTLASLRFQLGPGQLLRGRVIDEDGNPIIGAWVETTRRSFDKVEWSTTTDADGWFAWDSAPQEPLLYSFQAEGFNRAYALKFQADGSDHEVKLSREQPGRDTVQITGTAVDADTGLPLDSFKVLMSDQDPDWAFPFRFATVGQAGRFTWSFPSESSHSAYQIQIEKEGYLPAVSTNLLKKSGSQSLGFKLQKSSGPSGVVLLPDGEPAVNAIILLCTPQAGVTIDGPAHVARGVNTTTSRAQTDKSGRFSLAAASSPQGLIAIHDQGYAEVSLDGLKAAGGFVLQPWGRVEGRLVLDSQPVAHERIVVHNQVARYSEAGQRFNFLSFRLEAKTDSAGRFSFDKVPPGQCSVYWLSSHGPRNFSMSHETSAMVEAGNATEVLLGGAGRPVVGTALLPRATGRIDWESVSVRLRLKTSSEPGPRPKRADFSSRQAYIEASDKFFEAYRSQRRFAAFCDSNGSFRLRDIPAGTYQLEINLREAKPDSVSPNESSGPETETASLIREVIVPGTSETQGSEPLDLGTLELLPRRDSAALPR